MAAAAQAMYDVPDVQDDALRLLVEDELARISQHKLFAGTTRMKRFLSFVVTETLAGRGDRLKGYTIGLEVFDRPDSFDSQSDTIVRVQAGQLRRRLDLYYNSDGEKDPVRIVIPRGQYRPIFEVRNKGDVGDVIKSEAPKTNLTEVLEAETVARNRVDARPSVAVLTFENLTSDGEGPFDFFAEGVTAEIVHALVQFRHLRIVALMPTLLERTNPVTTADLYKDYNIDFALSGSVRCSGDVFRVSINLVSTKTGEHVFSKIFDKQFEAGSLFDIQDEIASYTAASLAAPYGALNRYNRRTSMTRRDSMSAYQILLRYYNISLTPDRTSHELLLKNVDELLEANPKFSSGWAIKSALSSFLVANCIPSADKDVYLAEAERAGTKASAIDPYNSLAYFALYQTYYHLGDMKTSDRMMERALSLNPNDYSVLAHYAGTRVFQGEYAKGAAFEKAALDLIIRPPTWFYAASLMNAFAQGRYEEVAKLVAAPTRDSSVVFQMLGLAAAGHTGKTNSQVLDPFRGDDGAYMTQALETLRHWHPNANFYDRVVTGWQKAGLDFRE